jgi:hypothetical protein
VIENFRLLVGVWLTLKAVQLATFLMNADTALVGVAQSVQQYIAGLPAASAIWMGQSPTSIRPSASIRIML